MVFMTRFPIAFNSLSKISKDPAGLFYGCLASGTLLMQ